MKLLIAVDGSECSTRAVAHAIRRTQAGGGGAEVHLLNVQNPLPSSVGMFVGGQDRREYHREEGMRALEPARNLLEGAGVQHEIHIEVGKPADVIGRYAEELGADEIILGSRGFGNIADMLLGSTSEDVLRASKVPVTVVK